MKLTELKDYFDDKTNILFIREIIKNEIIDYKRGLSEKGRSSPVFLIEDFDLVINANHLIKLLHDYINEKISDLEINYITDALLLSHRVQFVSEEIRNDFESLTDPEINGYLTKEIAEQKLKQLIEFNNY